MSSLSFLTSICTFEYSSLLSIEFNMSVNISVVSSKLKATIYFPELSSSIFSSNCCSMLSASVNDK